MACTWPAGKALWMIYGDGVARDDAASGLVLDRLKPIISTLW